MKREKLKVFNSNLTALIMVAVAVLSLITYGQSYALAEDIGVLRNFKRGETLPRLELQTVKNMTSHSFTPGSGKPSVIMFFSVRPEFRKKRALALLSTLSDLSDKYKTKLDVIAVFSDAQKVNTVRDFMEKSNIKLRVFYDKNKNIYNTYGVFMMPLIVLADADGKLHEIIPYTYEIRKILEGNIMLLLGEWDNAQLTESLKPKKNISKSKEEKEYIRRINYGRIMYSKKMYSQATREFSTAIKLMPQLIEAHVDLGFALLKTKKYDKAEVSFRTALKINPDSDEAIAGIGLAYYRRGDIDTALTELEKAFIAPIPRLEVILALADIYEQKGLNEKANRLNKLAVARLMTMYEQRWK
jgi:tetratricopeptide (TPR) repeat protein